MVYFCISAEWVSQMVKTTKLYFVLYFLFEWPILCINAMPKSSGWLGCQSPLDCHGGPRTSHWLVHNCLPHTVVQHGTLSLSIIVCCNMYILNNACVTTTLMQEIMLKLSGPLPIWFSNLTIRQVFEKVFHKVSGGIFSTDERREQLLPRL